MRTRLLSLTMFAALALPAVAAAAPNTYKAGPVFLGRGMSGSSFTNTASAGLGCVDPGWMGFRYTTSPESQQFKPAYKVFLKGTVATVTGAITGSYEYTPSDASEPTLVRAPEKIELSGSVDTAAPGYDGTIKIPREVQLTPVAGGSPVRISWPIWIVLNVDGNDIQGFVSTGVLTCA